MKPKMSGASLPEKVKGTASVSVPTGIGGSPSTKTSAPKASAWPGLAHSVPTNADRRESAK